MWTFIFKSAVPNYFFFLKKYAPNCSAHRKLEAFHSMAIAKFHVYKDRVFEMRVTQSRNFGALFFFLSIFNG